MKSFVKTLGCIIILVTLVLATLEVINLIGIGSMTQADPTKLIVILIGGAMLSLFCLVSIDWVLPMIMPIIGVAVLGFELYSSIAIFSAEAPIYADISNTTAGIIHICTGLVLSGFIFFVSYKMIKDTKKLKKSRV